MITVAETEWVTGGKWLTRPPPPEIPLHAAAIDTRALGHAEIFFALKGERGDGHDHLGKLQRSMVQVAVVSRKVETEGFQGGMLLVADPLDAMARMANHLVEKYRPKVVAITGSYGKTTAKEVVAHVLSQSRTVLKTPGSHNNEIGLPLALLELDGSQDTAVLEFSARQPGDIAFLGSIAPPDVAVLLGVGRAHIGIFGSQEAIYQTKGEIFSALRPGGLAIVAATDPRLRELAGEHRTVTLGGKQGDFRAEQITTDPEGRQSFTGIHGATRLPLRSGISGAHGHFPVLTAWAVARELGVPDTEVVARADFAPAAKGRAGLLQAPGGARILDDTYNASPETVTNLIASLANLEAQERILVLGHMSELEEGLVESAALIGQKLRPPLDKCLVLAPLTPEFSEILKGHAQDCEVICYSDPRALIADLRGMGQSGRVIGLKGARSAHLERVVEGLMGKEIACMLQRCGKLIHCTDCNEMTDQG